MPEVYDLVSLPQALETSAEYRFWLDECPGAAPLLRMLPSNPNKGAHVACLVGPEGGWADRERELMSGSPFRAASLGSSILRAETAAMAALTLVQHSWFAGTLPSNNGESV